LQGQGKQRGRRENSFKRKSSKAAKIAMPRDNPMSGKKKKMGLRILGGCELLPQGRTGRKDKARENCRQ